ncbi:MAG: hypothetical protein A2086_09465 [Spirochaetes bacterium GWD1_27_9]|nr:MAG: hypothetical protein A2Z98_06025 [Spirochaetes bacterium GWB1_27_13]OHD25025.1 MAG: hypothetical protein A2Y34_03095 [Spirochaetes bacterium GWC1_27_15]OHD29723.1 MAG: hypothetical protein A2086_09465 [Spirochaetes bacterium GWD1_27_9]
MLDSSYQGKSLGSYTFEIERGKIKELCLAIGDTNPLFFDKEYAQKEGYKDIPTPLTFPTVINFWGNPDIWNQMIKVGIDIKRLLHGKEEYEYLATLYPGDVVKGDTVVETMRSSTAMDMVTFKTTYTRGEEVVVIAKMTIVVPQGGEK